MIVYKKGELTKFIEQNSDLIPILEKDGWTSEDNETQAPRRGRPPKSKEEESE